MHTLLADASVAELIPAWVGAVGAVAAAVVAAVALIPAARQVRIAAKGEAADSEARTRPYLGIDVVPSLVGAPSFDITVHNHGNSTARKVTMHLIGADLVALSQDDNLAPKLKTVFAKPFDLAPQARRRLLWHMPDQPNASPRGAKGAPDCGEVRADYSWIPDGGRDVRHYSESFSYDLTDWPEVSPVPTQGMTANGNSTDANTHLRNIVHAVRAVASHLGEERR